MSDPDFNLLVALGISLSEASVAGVARRLNPSTSAISWTLSRLRDVIGDPILVRAGCNMVLTPWAEVIRDRVRRAVHEARAVLQPSTETFCARSLVHPFTVRANDGFVAAFGPALIVAVANTVPDVCIRFAPEPEKMSHYLREGLADLEIGVQSNMGPEIWLQRLFEDRFVGVARKGHPLVKQAEVDVGDYVAQGHVVASPDGTLHGSVDGALAELGAKRKIVSVVPGFLTALSVALESGLIAMIPTLYLLNQQVMDQVHVSELPLKSRRTTVSQIWHPRMERGPGYCWLRERILMICDVGRSIMIKELVQ